MKKIIFMILLVFSVTALTLFSSSCTSQRELSSQKSGAELWAQNCIRCHNIPSPTAYSNVEWETIGLHMKVRANMTSEQIEKVVAFLQTAN